MQLISGRPIAVAVDTIMIDCLIWISYALDDKLFSLKTASKTLKLVLIGILSLV